LKIKDLTIKMLEILKEINIKKHKLSNHKLFSNAYYGTPIR